MIAAAACATTSAAPEPTLGQPTVSSSLPPAPAPTAPAAEMVEVPRIRAYVEVARAQRRLAAVGLVGVSPDVSFPHYFVRTTPPAGTEVEVGSTVRLRIGDG